MGDGRGWWGEDGDAGEERVQGTDRGMESVLGLGGGKSMHGTDGQRANRSDRRTGHVCIGQRDTERCGGCTDGQSGGQTESTQEGRTACTRGTDGGMKGQTENAGAQWPDGKAVCVRWADGQTYKA